MQATSLPVRAICQLMQSFCLHRVIIHLTSYIFYIKFYLGMDNSSDTVLAKKNYCSSQNRLPFQVAAMCYYYVIKTIPSNAELCED